MASLQRALILTKWAYSPINVSRHLSSLYRELFYTSKKNVSSDCKNAVELYLNERSSSKSVEISNNLKWNMKQSSMEQLRLNLQKVKSVTELELLIDNYLILPKNEAAMILIYTAKNFYKLQTEQNDIQIEIQKFTESEIFLRLCQVLESNLQLFDFNTIVKLFKSFSTLKISCECIIMQKLLKLLLNQFNSLESLDVLDIYNCIQNYNNEEILKGVKLACLEFMNNCFDNKLNSNAPLQRLVYLIKSKHTPVFIKEKLINNILESDNEDQTPLCFSLISSAIFTPGLHEFCKNNQTKIRVFVEMLYESIDETWSSKYVQEIVTHYVKGCVRYNKVYKEDFCNKVVSIVVNCQYPFQIALNIARDFCFIPYYSYNLVKYINSMIPEKDLSAGEIEDIHLIFATSNFNDIHDSNIYNVKHSLQLQELERDSMQHSSFKSWRNVFKALNLACLKINDDVAFASAVNFINNINATNQESGYFRNWYALLLNQYLKVMYPSYVKPQLMNLENMWERTNNFVTTNIWLKDILSQMAGEDYILTKCKSTLFHSIAYVVLIDEFGQFVNLHKYKSTKNVNVEDIEIKENHKMILILEFSSAMKLYFKNIDHCTGIGSLYIQILETMGYNVLHLPIAKFFNLEQWQRGPYFKEQVLLKYATSKSSSNQT